MKKEVIKAIPASAALKAITMPTSTLAHRDPFVECAEINRTSMPHKVTEFMLRREEVMHVLQTANGMICICDDEQIQGYRIAAYDHKNDRWLRFKQKALC